MEDFFRKWAVLIVIFSVLAACSDDSDDPLPQPTPVVSPRGELVSATYVKNIPVLNYYLYFWTGVLPSINESNARYSVDIYRVVYKTEDPLGNIVNASGLLALPVKPPAATGQMIGPMLSYLHFTIFEDIEAPTNLSGALLEASVFPASLGYIVVMPDYIGFGESLGRMHTYVHAKGLAYATIDMMRATRTYLSGIETQWNGQLFLTGYSEGGYASMATHMEIEINLPDEFTVTAAVHGGGPYNMSRTVKTIIDSTELVSPSYVGYVVKAYDTYEVSKSGPSRINEIFNPLYVDVINTYYDGFHSNGDTSAALTTVTGNLFDSTFLDSYRTDGETALKDIFDANNVHEWIPSAVTRLYHGRYDDIVPYFNAEDALVTMNPYGLSDVSLKTCEYILEGAHIFCGLEYIDYMISTFNSISNL